MRGILAKCFPGDPLVALTAGLSLAGEGTWSMITTFIRYMSIAVNVAFIVFLVFLIEDEAGTLRWVRSVNQLWFFLGAAAIVVLAALLAEWFGRKNLKNAQVGQPGEQGGKLRSAA